MKKFIIILIVLFSILDIVAQDSLRDSIQTNEIYEEYLTKVKSQTLINRYFLITMIVIFVLSIVILRQMAIAIKTNKELGKTNEKLNKANKKLNHLSRTDTLTQISNRRDLYERVEYEQKRFQRSGKNFVVIMCDIDDFKEINDKFGHDAGDHILKSLAQLIRISVREQDAFGRWGGEEFLLLLPETDIEGGVIVAEKIRKNISVTPINYSEEEIPVTMTFGVALYNEPMQLDECIKKADQALYFGKQKGKNCVIKAPYDDQPFLSDIGKHARKNNE